ncbi:MAG TPA: 3'(2'),5'-bisphosphate nucleotidase CysQ [Haliangiales bacterium]|nr:3'(2'),5'-bisphosphate nucleotidase CysQ [Haliangiales bacterium]
MQRELDVATGLARAAGKLTLAYHGTDVTVDRKAGNEPVTRADREASELIVEGLRREFPADVVISEEAPDDERRLAGGRVWFIDPVDGTNDFIRGRAGFAVMIGLAVDGRPAAGVIYQPIGERMFWAEAGAGAWVAEGGEPRRLAVSAVSDVSQIRLVASKSHRSRQIDDVKNALGISSEMNIGSVGLKLGLIAMGEMDLYVNPSSKSKAWDTCAPEALLVAAGGRITDLWGEPLAYDRAELSNARGLLASNGILHDAVLARLRPLFP